jgi:SEC-C motif
MVFKRAGRYVEITSRWPEGKHEEFKARALEERSNLKEAAETAAHQALDILRKFNPVQLIGHVFIDNAVLDPESYQETSFEGSEAYIEYAQSLALAVRDPGTESPNTTAVKEFASRIEEVFENTRWYFSLEFTEGKHTDWEYRIRFMSVLRFLQLRGSSIYEHQRDLIIDLFSEHDEFLLRHVGFTTQQILAACDAIEQQVMTRLRESRAGFMVAKALHMRFREFVATRDPDGTINIRTLLEEFDRQIDPTVREQMSRAFVDPFRLTPSEAAPAAFLDRLSATFGQNSAFVENAHAPASPLGNSIIYTRPLIKTDDAWFCPNPVLLARKLDRIIERWIAEDESYFKNRFARKRGEFVERKAVDYFRALLPGASIHQNLYYVIRENGKEGRVETDAVITWDRLLFVVESKAGSVDIPARRGALRGLKEDLKEIVAKGFEQALRTRTYIDSGDEVSFENSNGEVVLKLRRADFDRTFLVNVTLEPLGFLGSQLALLKDMGILPGGDWPWSVYLNDLRVMSEILETGSDFVAMLESRIRAHDLPQFSISDELDILMMYLYEGADLTEVSIGDRDFFLPHGYTDDLDRYYSFLAGSVSSGPKPRSKMPSTVRQIVAGIEEFARPGFSRVTLLLLKSNASSMRHLGKVIDERVAAVRRSGAEHEVIIRSGDQKTVIAVSMARSWSVARMEEERAAIDLRKYDYHADRWLAIFLSVRDDSFAVHDYIDRTQKWHSDVSLDQEISERKTAFIRLHISRRGRPDRNASCPCRSGRRFKSCCARLL